MSRVVLEGLEFHARHGVFETEAVLGSRFIVDAELAYDFAGLPDDLAAAVNYAAVYEVIRQEVTENRVQLIEVLTDRIARRVLREQPKLKRVTVRVHKPFAPIPGVFRDVFAELTLEQA
ncbi:MULTISPECIES: dihydroneopterin aldolase [Deinococcus]|uniref:7,8-dihydroneopterin aldolase n=1 Tax=Deinococcus cavernae TaxID=2320857 RepID=A0A418V7N4_9DEIO|nr:MULTISPECIES: dihydroneopterin aldolase [Deinococcus]RJF72107.1 dihydroneopterin aldolase [Deinococcus cavernae]